LESGFLIRIQVMSQATGMTPTRNAVDAINTAGVFAGRFASLHVVSRAQISYSRSSRRFLRWVRFPAAPPKLEMSRSPTRWVRIKQAAKYYQVSLTLIRALIAHEQLEARRIGSSRAIRIDPESLLQLGQFKSWTTW
jgi:hypothetical protein